MLVLLPNDTAISDQINNELVVVQELFSEQLASDLRCVNELVTYIERYHGKMLRSTLVLVTGMASAPNPLEVSEAHRTVATVVEMTHLASLVHDDVLDDAEVRRRGATVNFLKGNEVAIMLGDYLFSHAYTLCSELDSMDAARLIARTTNVICAGELLQLANRDNLELDEDTYFEIVRRKTGSLCGACSQLGVMLNGCSDQLAKAMYQYGEKLGIAFQIIDDLLDITGSQETVGKTLGRDLEKQKLTLPVIQFLNNTNGEDRKRMMQLIQNHSEDKNNGHGNGKTSREVLQLLARTNAIDYAVSKAQCLVNEAKQGLKLLPESAAKRLLADMADAVVTRKF